MKAKGLAWYWNRLRAMDGREILFRITLLIKKKIWKLTKPNYKPLIRHETLTPQSPIVTRELPIHLDEQKNQILEEAECYLLHKWLFFGIDKVEDPINWHIDPYSQLEAPFQFGFDINHRDESLVGNIKNTWEKNRHHHLTILALAFYLTKQEKYAEEVDRQLKSWIDQNPYLIGVNWTHPLEQGIRLISWVYISFFLKESKSYESIFGADGFIWNSVFEHQKFIVETYSRGSSANNHLIGEMAGLFISAHYWPVFAQSKKWKSLSIQILEKELIKQTYKDGVNKELAFSYQIFVLEFAFVSFIADPHLFSDAFKEILRKKCNVIYDLSGIIGYRPNYGDGDEGMALQLQPLYSDRVSWLLSLSNKFLNSNYEWKDSLPHWLFNCPDLKNTKSPSDLFVSESSGIFAKKWKSNYNSLGVLIDFGPLGMGSLAAHGHADALSFVLSFNEKPVIIDPGTFCYHDNLNWRYYFRSVFAHNTIAINHKDQSEQTGPFLWGKRAESKLLTLSSDATTLSASHDGYLRNEGVIHQRKFDFLPKRLIISDSLSGNGNKSVELRFHFHPEIKIILSENQLSIPDVGVTLVFDSRLSAEILKGQPNGGWFSNTFGSKVVTNTLVLSQVLSLPVELSTEIKIIEK